MWGAFIIFVINKIRFAQRTRILPVNINEIEVVVLNKLPNLFHKICSAFGIFRNTCEISRKRPAT